MDPGFEGWDPGLRIGVRFEGFDETHQTTVIGDLDKTRIPCPVSRSPERATQ